MSNIFNRRDFLIGTGAGVLAGLVSAPANAVMRGSARSATLIYRNAKVWTGIPAQPWTDAIALNGNRIVALGERASRSLAARNTQLVDLGGAVVVPGARAVTVGAGRDWGLSLATPVIVKYRDDRTDTRTELESWIR